MQKSVLALLVGGILPAVLYGVANVFQKTSVKAGIGTGPYLIVIGCVALLAGIAVTILEGDTTLTWNGGLHACAFGVLWSVAISCIALALARYDAQISRLVPIYNLNMLVSVAVGMLILGEWREVDPWRVAGGAVLAVAGGILVASANR